MSNLRFKVVEEAFKKRPVEVATPAERPSEYFAKYVFNQEKMFKYLPLKTYKRLREAIEQGTPLPMSVADEVAQKLDNNRFPDKFDSQCGGVGVLVPSGIVFEEFVRGHLVGAVSSKCRVYFWIFRIL